eukprot:gene14899-18201_t
MSCHNYEQFHSRRDFLVKTGLGLGTAALAQLLGRDALAASSPVSQLSALNSQLSSSATGLGGLPGLPHFAPKAKRIIYLFQSGAPSQLELFDYKPKLEEMWGQDLPESIRQGQRLTGMTAGQSSFPLAASKYKFEKYGESQMNIS